MAAIRIEVNRKLCMGAGECVYSAPRSFEMDDESKAVAINPPPDDMAAIQRAVKGCPNFAVRVYPVD